MMALGARPSSSQRPNNLWVLTSGPVPPDPTEMLHIRFASVMKELREMKVLVLVDTPPMLPVSDARLIAPHTDGVLWWSRPARRSPSLQAALDRLRIVEAALLGLIINKAGADDSRRLVLPLRAGAAGARAERPARRAG